MADLDLSKLIPGLAPIPEPRQEQPGQEAWIPIRNAEGTQALVPPGTDLSRPEYQGWSQTGREGDMASDAVDAARGFFGGVFHGMSTGPLTGRAIHAVAPKFLKDVEEQYGEEKSQSPVAAGVGNFLGSWNSPEAQLGGAALGAAGKGLARVVRPGALKGFAESVPAQAVGPSSEEAASILRNYIESEVAKRTSGGAAKTAEGAAAPVAEASASPVMNISTNQPPAPRAPFRPPWMSPQKALPPVTAMEPSPNWTGSPGASQPQQVTSMVKAPNWSQGQGAVSDAEAAAAVAQHSAEPGSLGGDAALNAMRQGPPLPPGNTIKPPMAPGQSTPGPSPEDLFITQRAKEAGYPALGTVAGGAAGHYLPGPIASLGGPFGGAMAGRMAAGLPPVEKGLHNLAALPVKSIMDALQNPGRSAIIHELARRQNVAGFPGKAFLASKHYNPPDEGENQ